MERTYIPLNALPEDTELCERAGMSEEWEAADGDTFESVVYAAAEKFGIQI